MGIIETFSKRMRRAKGETTEVYVYDQLPLRLRWQICHLLDDALGKGHTSGEWFQTIHDRLIRELGVARLGNDRNAHTDLLNFILQTEDIESVLDAVEISFRIVIWAHNDSFKAQILMAKLSADEAISDLNGRFREHGIGYQFENGEIIRTDSAFLHQEAVKPALILLGDGRFDGAQTEFLRAHQHYRKGENEACLTDALKALESTLKVIIKKRKWASNDNDNCKALFDVAFKEGLLPSYLQNEFSGLRSTLEGGTPTLRNKQGGHGAGERRRNVPDHVAAYALHLTASAIVFLVECEKHLK